MSVVLLSSDLTVVSRIEGAAKIWGQPVRTFSSAAQALGQCGWEQVKLLIVDLTTLSQLSVDLKALMEALEGIATARPRVVAFGPHVHEERLAAARQAGCDLVMSRGQFFSQLNGILTNQESK